MGVIRESVVSVALDPVMPFATLPGRIDMNVDATEMRHVMEELMPDLGRDTMRDRDREAGRHRHAEISTSTPRR